MAIESLLAVREAVKRTIELEPTPKHPVLLLGGGSGTGKLLARRFALEGRPVYVGTRSKMKFDSLRDAVVKDGGIELKPFIADITNAKETLRAVEEMKLSKGDVIDFFPFAAAGFEGDLMKKIARTLVRLNMNLEKNGSISRKDAIAATEDLHSFMITEDALSLANATNVEAPLRVADELVKRGHLTSSSTVAVLSSTISKYTDPYDIDKYPGPWLYYPVGRSKAEGADRLKTLAGDVGSTFIDFIAPDIMGTGVGELFAKFISVYEALYKIDSADEFVFPSVPIGHVVNVILYELRKDGSSVPKVRDVYITHDTGWQYTPPKGFNKPATPYL